MKKLAHIAAATAVTAVLAGGALAPNASAANSHNYNCSNQGGGSKHTVYCLGTITVDNVLNNTTVNVGDVNVLSNDQLKTLQIALANVSDNDINKAVDIQLVDLQNTVVSTYLNKFNINLLSTSVKVCAAGVCV